MKILTDKEVDLVEKNALATGYDMGLEAGLKLSHDRTRDFTQTEWNEITEFLVKRGAHIVCEDGKNWKVRKLIDI